MNRSNPMERSQTHGRSSPLVKFDLPVRDTSGSMVYKAHRDRWGTCRNVVIGMRLRRSCNAHFEWAARKGLSGGRVGTTPEPSDKGTVVVRSGLAPRSAVTAQLAFLGWWSGEYGYSSAPGLGFTRAQLGHGDEPMNNHNVLRCLDALLALRRQLDDSHDPSILAEIDNAIERIRSCRSESAEGSDFHESVQHGLMVLGRFVGLLDGVAELLSRLRE